MMYGYPGQGYPVPPGASNYVPTAGAAYGVPNQLWEFEFRATGLDRKDILSKSDPFLQVSCSLNPGKHNAFIGQMKSKKAYKNNAGSKAKRQWAMVHKTETVMDSQHPTWRKFTLDINQVCVGNIDQAILLEVYDWDSGGGHDLLGKAITSLRSLQVAKEVILYNPRRIGITNRAGILHVLSCRPVAGPPPAPVAAAVTTTTYSAPVAPQPYAQTTVTYQQPAYGAPAPYGYPPQPGYGAPAYGAPSPYGYPPAPGGYPPAPGGYPPAPGGYPPAPGYGYPAPGY